MIIILAFYILFTLFVTKVMGTVDPPSPGKLNDLINNPYLKPEVFMQFENYESELLSDNILSKSQKPKKARRPTIRRKYADEKEAREARRKQNQEYNRNWRIKVNALPDGSELKEKKKQRKKESNKKSYQTLKNLPDGHEGKEAKLKQRRIYHQEWRKKLLDLPDDDLRKQKHLSAQRQAQIRFSLKRKSEDPEFFAKKQRQLRTSKQITQEANP